MADTKPSKSAESVAAFRAMRCRSRKLGGFATILMPEPCDTQRPFILTAQIDDFKARPEKNIGLETPGPNPHQP